MMLSKHLTNVIQNLEKKKFREKYNLYKVEGDKLVQELLLSDMKIDSLIARPSWIESNQQHVKKYNTIEVNEIEMGRIEKSDGAYHDRIIDIDLLMVDEQILHTERLTLPHPLMHKRSFVMEPLAEVAPSVKHPVFGKTMRELLSEL